MMYLEVVSWWSAICFQNIQSKTQFMYSLIQIKKMYKMLTTEKNGHLFTSFHLLSSSVNIFNLKNREKKIPFPDLLPY